ncbi:hypothetical protein GS495_25940 [Rhodococcus hoagii]|nr:hypothetical protein [Prescottella equi]
MSSSPPPRFRPTARAATRPRIPAAALIARSPRLHPWPFRARGNGFGEAHLRGQRLSGATHTAILWARPLRWACSPSAAAGAQVGWADGSDGRGDVAVLGGTSLADTGRTMPAPRRRRSGNPRGRSCRRCAGGIRVSSTPDGLARASLESVAEKTSDATVGALFWGAVAGVPVLLAYRASQHASTR